MQPPHEGNAVPGRTVPDLMERYRAGGLSRRQVVSFLVRAGISLPMVAGLLTACRSGKDSGAADDGTLPAAPTNMAAADGSFRPTHRGGGGALRLFWWQAPAILNPHLSASRKNHDGSRLFLEPLASIDVDATIIPILAAETPSPHAGTVEQGLTRYVIWKLKRGVTWHDGTPFTADDVIFTHQYVSDPETEAPTGGAYRDVQRIEKVDDFTLRVVFKVPTLEWSAPFVGAAGMILPRHIHTRFKGKEARNAPANLRPVGTGPYKVTEFRPNHTVLAEINDRYHVENRPFFDAVEMTGGGDALSAAQAVLQTGEYDYAWNLLVEAGPLTTMAKHSSVGQLVIDPGSSIEHINLNRADPNVEIDGERASVKAPHPFFSDLRVRRAFALAVDRRRIAEQIYGPAGTEAHVYAYTPTKYRPAGAAEYNPQKAAQLLDEAGWRRAADGVRVKDGKRLKVLFQTSVNRLRQDTQAVVQRDLEMVGIQVESKAIVESVFFSADPADPENFQRFSADLQMYAARRSGPDDLLSSTFKTFLGSEIKQKANNWAPANASRYSNSAFDKLYEQAKAEQDPTKLVDLLRKMNQLLVDDVAVIPIVERNDVSAAKKTLKGYGATPWDGNLWRIAYWYRQG